MLVLAEGLFPRSHHCTWSPTPKTALCPLEPSVYGMGTLTKRLLPFRTDLSRADTSPEHFKMWIIYSSKKLLNRDSFKITSWEFTVGQEPISMPYSKSTTSTLVKFPLAGEKESIVSEDRHKWGLRSLRAQPPRYHRSFLLGWSLQSCLQPPWKHLVLQGLRGKLGNSQPRNTQAQAGKVISYKAQSLAREKSTWRYKNNVPPMID